MKEHRWFLLIALALFGVPIVIAIAQGDCAGRDDGLVRVPGSHRHAESDDQWMGLIYPEPNDLSHYEIVGMDRNVDECLRMVRLMTGPGGLYAGGTYECALNCEERGPSGVMRCERTIGNEGR